MNVDDFSMPASEIDTLTRLLTRFKPSTIGEFGCGGSTRLLAENSQANIVSFDNMDEWIGLVKKNFAQYPWGNRVEFHHYLVTPEGPRNVEKDALVWQGPAFDFLFIDGPRSAHRSSYGRYGSFKFALKHVKPGGCIAWHDFDREHEQKLAEYYFGKFYIHRKGRMGWCVKKEAPLLARSISRFLRRHLKGNS